MFKFANKCLTKIGLIMKNLYFILIAVMSMLLLIACPSDSDLTGCTDTLACNYNTEANIDDGSCILPDGCVDVIACNYNENATCDDSSCLYESDALDNPIEIIYVDDYVVGNQGEDVIAHVHLRNSDCQQNTISVRKFFTNVDASAYFCFNNICFPSSTIVSPNPLNLNSFEEDDYFKSYLNASAPGIYEVTYRFYLEDEPAQFNSVVITYEIN